MKRAIFYSTLLVLGLFFLFSSCRKEGLELLVTELNTPTQAPINDLVFVHRDTGYAVGGIRWKHGEWLRTVDAGETWISDTLVNNELNGLSYPDNGHGYVVGFLSRYFSKNLTNGSQWQFKQLDNPESLHSVAYYNDNLGVAVGGGSFHTGVIFRFDNSLGNADTIIYPIDHELRDVCFLDAETLIIVGYGIVLKSVDAGRTWQPNAIDGDFFYGLHFPTRLVGYAVGFTGSIIKTKDGGNTWEKLRNGNRLFTSREKFRDVFFTSQDEGYIVGDEGLFWKTTDGGGSWKVIDMPNVDLNSISVLGGIGHISADKGRIFKFVD